MRIEKIYLSNFKNYSELQLSITEEITCLVGENGSGKTNLLDAIYYLSLTKSAFLNDNSLIKKDENQYIATGKFLKNEESFFISSSLEVGKKKQFLCNKKPYSKISQHIGNFPVVLISPYDTNLIHEGSSERRKFFDGIIAQFNPEYLNTLLKYGKLIKQRNSILKKRLETGYFDKDLIWSLDKQIIPLAKEIVAERAKLLKNFIPKFQSLYKHFSQEKEKVDITYQTKLIESDYKELLETYIERDMASGRTNVGAHKDDFIFTINDMPLNKYGSQGQQKTFIIALKIANFQIIEENTTFKPILLLDDIFDRIDEKRIDKFIEMINNDELGQIFITDTHFSRINDLFKDLKEKVSIFKVDNGIII